MTPSQMLLTCLREDGKQTNKDKIAVSYLSLLRYENIFRKYFLKYLFTVISTTVQKAYTFKSPWSRPGVLRSYLNTATLTAEQGQAPKRRSLVKGWVTFKFTACTAVLSGRPHSGMRPSCARCHWNALFVTTENTRLWVGWKLRPGETRKLSTSFIWEQPESSGTDSSSLLSAPTQGCACWLA